jgi:hypothetical protein
MLICKYFLSMRTMIQINEALLQEVKQLAAHQGKTLSRVIEDALRAYFVSKTDAEQRRPVHLPTFSGNGLLPGVDLDNSVAFLDLTEK